MRFGESSYLHLLWFVAALGLFLLWAYRNKQKLMGKFAETKFLPILLQDVSFRKQKIKNILILLAVTFIIFALAQPQWGFHWEEVKRKGVDIIIAIDTSRSMLAEDVKPNRIEKAKMAIKDMVNILEGDRIGLIAFAGYSFVQCPLTLDYNAFLLSLENISAETIPRGGTAIARAINEAASTFEKGEKKYKVLIIITDGEDHEGDPLAAAKKAAKEGVTIFTVGIGTEEGELIPVTDEDGNRSFLKDRSGRVVKSHLDEQVLQQIALATNGAYVHAAASKLGVDTIYQKRIASMEKKQLKSRLQKRYDERFQFPLILALTFLCLEVVLGERNR